MDLDSGEADGVLILGNCCRKVIECGVVGCFLSSGVVASLRCPAASSNDVRPCTSATANRGVHAGARFD